MILGPSGQNIYPEEIEQKLNNLPYVNESIVIERDGKIIALVHPDYDLAQSQGLNDDDIKSRWTTTSRRSTRRFLPTRRWPLWKSTRKNSRKHRNGQYAVSFTNKNKTDETDKYGNGNVCHRCGCRNGAGRHDESVGLGARGAERQKMYIINLDTRERIDSAVVKNGKLVFATEVGAGEAVPAAIAEGSKRRLSFILEPGTATINDRGQVKGTRLNNIVEGVGDMLDSLTVDYKARQKQIMQSQMSNDEKMKAAETLYNDVAQKSGDILVETYKANKTNAAGYMMFLQIADGMTVAEMDELLDGAVQWIKESNAVASYKQKALSMEKTAPGQMFTDFSVKMSNGKTVKLSDYVGKGDYVVLDFFASWCGPCRREMPTLKGIYENITARG